MPGQVKARIKSRAVDVASSPDVNAGTNGQATPLTSAAAKSYDTLGREQLIQLLEQRDAQEAGGIRLTYKGQTPPWQIVRKVQPRRQKIEKKHCTGSEDCQAENLVVEGENLQAMVSLYKYRGQVDLVLTDPPYNTGLDFRYNDKWDEDPNDPDLGELVPADDGSRHSKWLKFMTPRLWMMKEMLKPGGVLAICIDHRELYRLGILLDQIFDEDNRLGIINWQKAHSPKNASTHLSSATEYVLVYSKDKELAKTGLLPRSDDMDKGFRNPDGDPEGEWLGRDVVAPDRRSTSAYAIQSPFTGTLHYPRGEYVFSGTLPRDDAHWRGFTKKELRKLLEAWGTKYELRDLGDGRGEALVIAGSSVALSGYSPSLDRAVSEAKRTALTRLDTQVWPRVYFRDDRSDERAAGRPRAKTYLKDVKRGKIPMTFWADDVYEDALQVGSQSWEHTESGHSQDASRELDLIVGRGHGFKTVKPLKLIKKIIQIWCPANGIVMDPFAGSGTTGHAVLSLNHDSDTQRRFVLVEQGRPERGDSYARTLTYERIKRAITGERPDSNGNVAVSAPPLRGGFRFTQLSKRVDGDAVLALEREEMLDLLLTTHWDQNERAGSYLMRMPATADGFLFAVNSKREGYFLVWNGPDKPSVMNRDAFRAIAEEAKSHSLKPPYHVYARISNYSGPNVEFYQIPNRILEKLGFNEATDGYGTGGSEEGE